jgi:hypothetical protein
VGRRKASPAVFGESFRVPRPAPNETVEKP